VASVANAMEDLPQIPDAEGKIMVVKQQGGE